MAEKESKHKFDSALYSGGDGSTIENAIVINTTSSPRGVTAEYEYVANIYGQRNVDWTVPKQSLMEHNDRYYDVLYIRLKNADELTLYFDIITFFGKY